MSVSSISSGSGVTPTDWLSVINQFKQDFKQLASALKNGDLAGAQAAFKALQQLLQGNPTGGQPSSGQANSTSNPIQSDFAAVGQALSSGDLSGAQSAFAQLQSDMMQAAVQNNVSGAVQATHHGHHHHRHASSEPDTASSTSGTYA